MSRTSDPFDELAAMFLSAPIDGSTADPPCGPASPIANRTAPQFLPLLEPALPSRRHTARSELLIMGHLPVRGGLWLTPYADALAREHGPTALIRLDGEEPTLQLFRDSAGLSEAGHGQTLRDAIESVGRHVECWIVRPPIVHRAEDLIRASPDRITILSSADEAATVSAYQLIKELSQAAKALQCPPPAVSLAVVGTDAQTASALVERLNRTTISFLGVDIELGSCMPRIDAGVRSTRYSTFPNQHDLSLGDIMTWIERAQASADQGDHVSGIAGQIYADRAQPQIMDAERILRASPPARQSQPRRTPVAAEAPPVSVTETAPIKLAPKPAAAMEPKQPPRAQPDDGCKPIPLSRHVAGLTALPVRSPGHECVELAVDGDGRMHLLTSDAGGTWMRELNIVSKWAAAHHELISLACSRYTIDGSREPVCHVFTDQPAAVADLHGTGLRLHVLAPVHVNGQTAWYSAPLNSPI